MGRTEFSDQFRKIKIRHKRIVYDLNVMRQSACLVISTITVDNFTVLSSIGAGIASFQDGRQGSKMAAMTPRWPLWLRPSPVKGYDL